MMEKEKREFMAWYDTVVGGVFDFRKEMAEYCKNDVVILREGCLRFRGEIINSCNLDPFQCVTIASVCMKQFCMSFLPENTVALTTPDNYIKRQKAYSTPSIQWLEYIAHREQIEIQHALCRGEVKMGPYYLDGYAETGGVRTAYEFAGCFFHGCPECFDSHEVNPVTKLRFGDMHQQFQDKIFALKNTYNLNVYVIWEHQWNKLKAEKADVQAFLREFDFPERIDPRDALFGGRTNALQLHYKAQSDERIDYYDFTSLYPSVNKFKEYPVGHPVIIYNDFDSIENYFGVIKAKVYPPRGLYLPVLPYRCGGKLMFTLCRTCCEAERQGVCNHSDEQRALIGTWCSVEINKAVEKGYKIVKIYEVWHFPDRTDTLFAGYINNHLKGKQEASGYPSWAKSAEDKERYIQTYFEKEGIRLNPENIGVNKVKRKFPNCF